MVEDGETDVTITQKVDSTTITVEYYRPSVRGRTIFGQLVPWGITWTPGANWATTLEVDRDVRIDGHPVPRGKYSVWMIPAAKPDPWTVVLNRSARRFHVMRPDAKDDELRAGQLWVRTTSEAVEPGLDPEFDLLAAGEDDFHPRQYKNGSLIGDELDEVITFIFEGGRTTGFDVHGTAEDKILSRARRVR